MEALAERAALRPDDRLPGPLIPPGKLRPRARQVGLRFDGAEHAAQFFADVVAQSPDVSDASIISRGL